MKLQNKFFLFLFVSFLKLIISGVAFADEAPAMDLVENGTVSGDAQIIASNPWKTSGNLEYTIPDNADEIKSVNVVVSSYSGSGAPTYALYSNITLNTKNGLEILGYEDLFCDMSMTNDPTVYIINNHTTKQYSDYQSFYNITDSVKTLSPGDTIKISVENSRKEGYNFDARIKLIALTFAYNDGDNDKISYWLNLGQSWTQSTRSNLIKTKDFNGEYDDVTFENIALSTYPALCRINNKLIYDPIYEKQGSYFINQIYNITDKFVVGQDTNFTYRASSSGYGSYKSSMQLLKTIKTYHTVKSAITPQYKDTIFAGVKNNITLDVYSNQDFNAIVKLYNNNNLVYSDNLNLTGGISKKLYYIDPTIRPITADTVNGVNNKHEIYTLVIENSEGVIFNSTYVNCSVLYNGNLGKDFAYPASNATVNRFYNITGDIIILTQDDSNYMGSSETHHESSFNVDSADINEGLLYVAYNWDKIPSNDFNSWNITFNNNAINPIAYYRDQSNLGTYGKYGYGLVVYNVSDFIEIGENSLVLDKDNGGCAVYPLTLVLLTNNNASSTYKLVYIAENADLLSKPVNIESGSYAFMDDVESENLLNSTLYIFAAGGESGEGNIIVNEAIFNNVWNKTSKSIDYYAVDMSLFTFDSNKIYFQSTGSTILALQDILVVEFEKIIPELNVKAESIVVGENLTVDVSLPADATGDVSIDNRVVSLVNGKASFVISDLPVGPYTFTVKYSGDDKYNPTNKTTSITVYDKEPEKVTPVLYVDGDDIYVGDDLTIAVTLPSDATGDVSIDDQVVSLVNGKASFVISDLVVGSYTFTVKYSGDLKYNTVSNKTKVNVINVPKVTPVMTLEADDNILVGENLTIAVTLPSDATGEVSIGNKIISLVNGKASFVISDLVAGSYTFTVKYSGDEKYNPVSNKTSVNVNVVPKDTPVLYIDANDIYVGDDLTIAVTLPSDATGDVSINDRVVSLVNGKASFVISDLAVGTYTFTVKYSGDEKYNSVSNKTTVNVDAVPKITPVMNINAKNIVVGENLTIAVSLPSDATGYVNIDSKIISLVNGKASFVISDLAVGTYTFTVKYSGDEKYNPTDNSTIVKVNDKKTVNLSVPDVSKYYGGSERLYVYLTDLKGLPIVNETVTIIINGRTYDRPTDKNGVASIALGLNSGVYNVNTSAKGETVNSLVTIKTTVNGTDITKIYRNGTQYYATFLDREGKYLADGTAVRFNINGVFYDRHVSGNKGLARLNLNLGQGKFILTAMNLVTGENTVNNITIISKLVENKDLTKYYRNDSQYTVKVLGDDGKVVGAGVTVTFNINGVFYQRQTNASGIAKLSINLIPGDYIITAEYGGSRVSNNIKVLPILSANDLTKKYGEPKAFEAKLVDGTGKAYANQNIQFNINGVFYNRVTGDDGIAKLNINLMPGQYIITSMFGYAAISNTVKVTS